MDIKVKKRNGRLVDFQVDKINARAQRACEDISDISASEIVLDAQLQLYDKIPTTEIDKALISDPCNGSRSFTGCLDNMTGDCESIHN